MKTYRQLHPIRGNSEIGINILCCQEDAFENVACKVGSTLIRPQSVNLLTEEATIPSHILCLNKPYTTALSTFGKTLYGQIIL